MRIWLVYFFAVLWATSARALSDCSTIDDISKDLGPVWSQGDTSWCHVFTAADCETQHLLNIGRLKKGERLSPLAVGVKLAMERKQYLSEATDTAGTMAGDIQDLGKAPVNQFGACKESDLKDEKDRASALYGENWQFSSKIFSDGLTAQCGNGESPSAATPIGQICQALLRDEYKFWQETFAAKCHTNYPPAEFQWWHLPQRFKEVQEAKPPTPNLLFDQQVEKKIDTALRQNELAAIGYDATFFLAHPSSGSHSHWSSVVGRHKGPDGKCYYLVRNSWGESCQYYKKAVNCKNGYLTIPADVLLRNIHTVQYIENAASPAQPQSPKSPDAVY